MIDIGIDITDVLRINDKVNYLFIVLWYYLYFTLLQILVLSVLMNFNPF